MSNHIGTGGNSAPSQHLRAVLRAGETYFDGLPDVVAAMAQMLEGDGSDDSHYTDVATKYGYTSNAKAHAAYSELSSLLSKINTDAEVTNASAAHIQAFARFR